MFMLRLTFRSRVSEFVSRASSRLHRLAGGVLAGLLLCLLVPLAPGQVPRDQIEKLAARLRAEPQSVSREELAALHAQIPRATGFGLPDGWQERGHFREFTPARDLPARYDWRDVVTLTPPKDQGYCGSCWAFAVCGVVENHFVIKKGTTLDLSEQWLVSCNPYGYGCNGGFEDVYEIMLCQGQDTDLCGKRGLVLEADFPYAETDLVCACNYMYPYCIEEWGFVGTSYSVPAVAQIKQAIYEFGPVSCGIVASDAFSWYPYAEPTVVFATSAYGSTNHAVVLAGWDDSRGKNGAWLLRNSWVLGWGFDAQGRPWWDNPNYEGGYCWIEYGCSKVGEAAAYVGFKDCNNNGVSDKKDVASGTSADCDQGGVPDECQTDLAPQISQHPQSVETCAEEPVTFSAEALGVGIVKYQWRHDGVEIPDAKLATYSIASASDADQGAYDAVVSTDCGDVVTNAATLAIKPCVPAQPHVVAPAHSGEAVSPMTALRWTRCARADHYEVYCGDAYPPVFVGQTTEPTLAVQLKYNTSYYWRVAACNAQGIMPSAIWSFKTVLPPPEQPSALTQPVPADGAADIATSVRLTWAGGVPAENYQILVGTKPGSLVFSGSATLSDYAPTEFDPGTIYYWQVVALNEGLRTSGPIWSFKTAGAAPVDPNEADPNEAEPNEPNVPTVDPNDPNDPNNVGTPTDGDPNDPGDPNQVQRVLSDVCPTTAATLVSLTLAGFFATRPRGRRLRR